MLFQQAAGILRIKNSRNFYVVLYMFQAFVNLYHNTKGQFCEKYNQIQRSDVTRNFIAIALKGTQELHISPRLMVFGATI